MKKKLRLLIEDLNVEQVQVEFAVAANRGTVHGYWETEWGCPNMPITYSCEYTPCC